MSRIGRKMGEWEQAEIFNKKKKKTQTKKSQKKKKEKVWPNERLD